MNFVDAKDRPTRPLPSGQIPLGRAKVAFYGSRYLVVWSQWSEYASPDGTGTGIFSFNIFGQFVEPIWSFVSLSEISEYVPTIEQFRERLIREGGDPESEEVAAKVTAYERRLPMMNQQRLKPISRFGDYNSYQH